MHSTNRWMKRLTLSFLHHPSFHTSNPPPSTSEEAVPVEVIRRREKKWLEMFSSWDTYMLKRYKKVRDRCRKGIPSALRARAWQHLCGAHK